MQVNLLAVSPKEQTIVLQNNCVAEVLFDRIYKRWYYNLYKYDELIYAGIVLIPNTAGLLTITNTSLGIVDMADDKEDYEPYAELGSRLALAEITE